MKRPFVFSLGLSLLFALASGCAASYRPIEPATVSFDQFQDNLGGGQAEIAWRYNVLKEAGNRHHARKERQHGVSLLALRFTNNSQGTALGSGLFKINKQVRDNLRLARDLDAHYLQGRQVAPGNSVTGLLALPVAPGTGLKFELKKTGRAAAK